MAAGLTVIKMLLSPAGAWAWAELGKNVFFSLYFCPKRKMDGQGRRMVGKL